MKTSGLARIDNQNGFASLIIALVLVLVLGLMTVGFAELMRKEQRSSLDKQLSSQAYYAAESGLNDASKAINSGFSLAKTTCGPYTAADIAAITDPKSKAAATYLQNNIISNDTGSSYPCLLIDPAPKTYEASAIDTEQSTAILVSGVDPLDPSQPRLITTLVISWRDVTGGNSFVPGAASTFPPVASWPYAPVLRIGITPLASGMIDRANLFNNTHTTLGYPRASASVSNSLGNYATYSYSSYTGRDGGGIISGKCNAGSTPQPCNVAINNLGQANYLVDLRSYYKKSRVTITAYDFSGVQLRIKNAQTLVDSTGKAQDVLRRLQARIPSKYTYEHPDYGIETTGNLCKQLQLFPAGSAGTSLSECTP
jgi:Tfp pilus assembly protein PilX